MNRLSYIPNLCSWLKRGAARKGKPKKEKGEGKKSRHRLSSWIRDVNRERGGREGNPCKKRGEEEGYRDNPPEERAVELSIDIRRLC